MARAGHGQRVRAERDGAEAELTGAVGGHGLVGLDEPHGRARDAVESGVQHAPVQLGLVDQARLRSRTALSAGNVSVSGNGCIAIVTVSENAGRGAIPSAVQNSPIDWPSRVCATVVASG